MCMAIPMKLVEVEGETGVVELDGLRQTVNLALIEEPEVGQFVIVHAGFAIERLDEAEAAATLALFAELAEDAV